MTFDLGLRKTEALPPSAKRDAPRMTEHPMARRSPGSLALLSAFSAFLVIARAQPSLSATPMLVGVNLPSATFAEHKLPGQPGVDYFYPNEADVDYYIKSGMNVVRLGFIWERLQPVLDGPFDHSEARRLRDAVKVINRRGAVVILDLHNYARYRSQIVGSTGVPAESFADFWAKLASAYKGNDRVVFGLMNEPHGIDAGQWQRAAQAAINRIRQAGAHNRILVPSSRWDGASHFVAAGDVWNRFVDPINNFAFEVHQYVDADNTGTHAACPNVSGAVAAIQEVTQWMRQNRHQAFLGEFGGSGQEECLAALSQMLMAMQQNPEVWLGWTYFAGGRGWADDDILSIQPTSTGEKPQMKLLRDFLH